MKKGILFATMLAMAASGLHAATISVTINHSKSALKFISTGEGYEKVFLAKTDIINKAGDPQLPVDKKYVSLPFDAAVDSVKVSSYTQEYIDGYHDIYPAQKQVILSKMDGKTAFTQPSKSVYESHSQYPGKIIEYKSSGYISGKHIAEILIYPLQYIPAEKRLEFYSSIELTIYFHNDPKKENPSKALSAYSQVLYDHSVRGLTGVTAASFPSKDAGFAPLEYLIITKPPLDTVFQRLADWKTAKGIPGVVRNVDWIAANYPGSDTQEKIRNYLKIAHSDSGLTFLLLGGDVGIVPVRNAFAMDCEMGGGRNNIFPCDLYYSDLDGTWNADGDTIYGEVSDSVDLYPDIFVGRASADSLYKARAFVDKILTYEKNPPTDYQLKALFDADILWTSPYTDEGIAKDMIQNESFPDRYVIAKHYESLFLGGASFDSVNAGRSIINHCGHGWIAGGLFDIYQMDSFTNNPRNGILYSIGCWTNAFDYDASSEHFVNNPNGGGVAYIGNTSYGWGSPGNPGYGYSDLFDAAFFRELFNNNFYRIGTTLAQAKASYIAQSREENVYRWHQYDVNLIGDPEMPIWTDTPGTLELAYPQMIPAAACQVRINVSSDTHPLENALVCLQKDAEVYARGCTAGGGDILFDVIPATMGKMTLTVTAQNHLPSQADILVGDSLAYADIIGYAVDDSSGGNGDGMINPGEAINLAITLKNFGDLGAPMVSATMQSGDTLISILDSQQVYGDISPGDSSSGTGRYRFTVSVNATNEHHLGFVFQISDSNANTWPASIALTAATPVLSYYDLGINDTAGNNNGLAEPGETIGLSLGIKNKGLGLAEGVVCSLSTSDTSLAIIDAFKILGNIPPDSVRVGNFNICISPGSVMPHVGVIKLSLITEEGYFCYDSLAFEVGQTGFMDIMEHETEGWTHSGTNDLWHISPHRGYSGFNSWYCGQEGSWQYINNMKAMLVSPPFILGPKSKLSFRRAYGLTLYGTDGLFTEIFYKGKWDTLGYIGSGGALDSMLGLYGDWTEEVYDLSQFGYGDTARIKFTFISDVIGTAEGFYIDDFRVQSTNRIWTDLYLKLQDPNGGDVWTGNQAITWVDSSKTTSCYADVYLSTNGGNTWNVLALDVPDSGFFNYNSMLTIDGVRNKVGVCIHGDQKAAYDISDSVFIINNPGNAKPEVMLCFPLGGDSLWGVKDLLWYYGDADNDSLSIMLDYTRDEGCQWQSIATISVRSQRWSAAAYSWDTRTLPNDTGYKVKISIFDGTDSISDISGSIFTIYNLHDTVSSREHISGAANTVVFNPYMTDQSLVTGHRYELRFREIQKDTTSGNNYTPIYSFDLWDATASNLLVPNKSFSCPQTANQLSWIPDPIDGVVPELKIKVDRSTFSADSFKIIDDVNILNQPSCDTLKAYATIDQYWPWRGADYEIKWHVKEGPHDTLDTLRPEVWDIANGTLVPLDTSIGWTGMKKSSWAIGATAGGRGRDCITYNWPSALYSFIYICGSRFYFNRAATVRKMTWETKPEEGEVWAAYTSGQIPPHDGDIYAYTTTKESSDTSRTIQTVQLFQNWPNPFNKVAVISYQLPKAARVRLKIYNISGQLIKTLIDQVQAPGFHTATWRGINEAGNTVSAGLYFYRLETGDYRYTKKMLFLR
ncbi:MAG: C25 family cysteine peptidase [Candidatus Edwardsbacteria bacterium]|nr:C25 family cysteine peptidase [Candidatus Edwardsbacteria bacterium]